jgi:uncharacterized repeat protein (TIGR03803 family)
MRFTAFLVALAGGVATALATGPIAAEDFHIEYRFRGGARDASRPVDVLVKVGRELYGVSGDGGPADAGTIFAFDPATGGERMVHGFNGGRDVAGPVGAPVKVGHKLFGTSVGGGASGDGAIYSFDLATKAEKVEHSFSGGADGAFPLAGMVEDGGKLYGTTYEDTIFSFDPATAAEAVVYTFKGGDDGASPEATPLNLGGTLFGTTDFGGASHLGTIYSFNPASGAETVLYAFKGGTDGAFPLGQLIEVGGILYGTTALGGPQNEGVLFSFDPETGVETVLHVFGSGDDGMTPAGGLAEVGGTLFGATSFGGRPGQSCIVQNGCGVLFSFDLATGIEKLRHNFAGAGRGYLGVGGLFKYGNQLYGMTSIGGAQACGCGVLYSFTK